ncbi:MAG: protein kinase [Deltaproteobacteria bacterium]|nr:protein kinase [Deltaproteobacteria bacterium]
MEPAAGMQVTPSVKLVSPLDTGGMGAVWLAEQTGLKQTVVVKFMLGELDTSGAARARFAREAAAAAAVKSPHVVQMLDHGTLADGTPFIVMEHLEGHDLGDELAEKGALPPARVVAIVTQVAKALSKAHAAGVLHRDIKPPNIFLCKGDDDDEPFVKLLDFGIAKSRKPDEPTLDGETKTGQVVGTPFYMSPEQVTAQKEIDLRSDLWSLAVVAFELLTGQRPFEGPSFGALAVKIATGTVPKPSSVNAALPPSIDAWFAKACAREPSERFASARELADKLRAAFDGVVSLPPLSPGMSDSGPRDASVAPASRTPVSIDPEAGSRPSFALASTVDHREEDASSLARSEGGTSPVAIESTRDPARDERRGPSRAVLGFAVLGVCGALVAAYVAGGSTKDTPDAGTGTALPREPSNKASAHASATPPPSASFGEVPPSTSASATPSASAPSASASASGTASAASDAGPAAPVTAATPVTTRPVGVAPRPSASAAPSAKVAPSATARPHPTSSGEIDVY